MAIVTQQEMAKRGVSESLLSIIQHVNLPIPDGAPQMPCADIFAAYATLRVDGGKEIPGADCHTAIVARVWQFVPAGCRQGCPCCPDLLCFPIDPTRGGVARLGTSGPSLLQRDTRHRSRRPHPHVQ